MVEEQQQLEALTIPELFATQRKQFDAEYPNALARWKENIAFKFELLFKAILRARSEIDRTTDPAKKRQIVRERQRALLDWLQTHCGLHVNFEHEGIELDELREQPVLFLGNHQGGGLETMILHGLLGLDFRPVLKDSLMRLPVFGGILNAIDSIPISRQSKSVSELRQVFEAVAGALSAGESVMLFPDGTRSQDGQIGAEPSQTKYGATILKGIDHTYANLCKTSTQEPRKILVVVDTLNIFPDPLEKFPLIFGKTRMRGSLSVRLIDAAGLGFKDNPANQFDTGNVFGMMRANQKSMLIASIRKTMR